MTQRGLALVGCGVAINFRDSSGQDNHFFDGGAVYSNE
jgi:hypothetical protein